MIDLRPFASAIARLVHEAIVRDVLARHLSADVPVYVDGSRAKGRAKPMSDLDLALDQGHEAATS